MSVSRYIVSELRRNAHNTLWVTHAFGDGESALREVVGFGASDEQADAVMLRVADTGFNNFLDPVTLYGWEGPVTQEHHPEVVHAVFMYDHPQPLPTGIPVGWDAMDALVDPALAEERRRDLQNDFERECRVFSLRIGWMDERFFHPGEGYVAFDGTFQPPREG